MVGWAGVELSRAGKKVCRIGVHEDGKFLNLTSVLSVRSWDPGTIAAGSTFMFT